MAKCKVYLRLAKTNRARDGWKVDAAMNPNPRPLSIGQGFQQSPVHTVRFALMIEIPDHLLRPGDWPTIEIALPDEAVEQIPDEVVPVVNG